jgi:hypothetical protein
MASKAAFKNGLVLLSPVRRKAKVALAAVKGERTLAELA